MNIQFDHSEILLANTSNACTCGLQSCVRCVPGAAANNNCMNGGARVRCGCGGNNCSCPANICHFNNLANPSATWLCIGPTSPDGKGCFQAVGCTGKGRKGCECALNCIFSATCLGSKSCSCGGYKCTTFVCNETCKRGSPRYEGIKDVACAVCKVNKTCDTTHEFIYYGAGISVSYIIGAEITVQLAACLLEICNGNGMGTNYCIEGGCGGCSKFPCDCGAHSKGIQYVMKNGSTQAIVKTEVICSCLAPSGFCKCSNI